MDKVFKDRVEGILASSELAAKVKEMLALADRPYRALTEEEVAALEGFGNECADWSKVKVVDPFDPSRLRDNTFVGDVLLGAFTATVQPCGMPVGIRRSTLVDCVIGNDVTIRDVGLLRNYVVGDGAVVSSCGTLDADDPAFGNGIEIPIAIETGGREVLSFAELPVDVAAEVAGKRADGELQSFYADFVSRYIDAVKAGKGIVCGKATVMNTTVVLDSFIGEGAVVNGAVKVANSCVLSSTEEVTEITDGALLDGACVQWGCEVTSMAIVKNSVLTEHSHVERHGKVTDSIIGPNTGIAEGEVTASLVGPFVGFHHQSLLIAAFWPEGKGNVGYGANVGSNHTSKAPDQELWPGEGTFFGLGVNVKFPSNFTKAPYTIIATGVSALPQKVEFPFSLINTPSAVIPGISPAFNEIFPGWVLSDNIFTLKRNEGKYKKRNKARRTSFVFDVFRPDTMDLVKEARKRLQAVSGKEVYTDKDVPGLGKNYMTERARLAGIEAYTFYLRYYALKGLLKVLKDGADGSRVLEDVSDDAAWEHCRQILLEEFPGKDVKFLLEELVRMEKKVAEDVEESKRKDDKRGARIIPDYADAHTPAAEDSFVKQTWEEFHAIEKEIRTLLESL